MNAPFTVRPAGCVAWRERVQTFAQAKKWRDDAVRAGLRNVLIIDTNGVVLRDCGCDVEALNGEHRRLCAIQVAREFAAWERECDAESERAHDKWAQEQSEKETTMAEQEEKQRDMEEQS